MAGRLSFSIAVNLLTENFKKGTNRVKESFRSMQAQALTFAAALGAGGIGLSNLLSRFVEVARETGRVTTALKNVSGSAMRFAGNQRYLINLARKYGQDVNILTNSFAKFTATATSSGMAMDEQKKVFESVSRAVSAFSLSADDSNGVFLAISQMMGKGKVSSEELRLQLGERLPIAMQAMAKAAGTTVAGLDDLMRQGKLMSADVLPKFAEALNEMIPEVDTDNIETSVNSLKNLFTEVVKSSGFQEFYKSLIDGTASAIGKIRDGFSGLAAFIATVFTGKMLQSVVAYFAQYWNMIGTTISVSQTAEQQKLLATQKRIAAELALEQTKTAYNTIENGKRLATAVQVNKAERALTKAALAESKAADAARAASAKAAAVQSSTAWGKAMNTMKLAAVGAWVKIQALWSTVGQMALISALAAIVGYFTNMYAEAKRVKNIFSDYKKEAEGVTHTAEITQLQTLQKLYNDAAGNRDRQKQIQAKIESSLGVQIKKEQDINSVLRERIRLLEANAEADFYTRKKVELQARIGEIASDVGLSEKQLRELAKMYPSSEQSATSRQEYYSRSRSYVKSNGGRYHVFKQNSIDLAAKEYLQTVRVLTDASRRAESAIAKTVTETASPLNGGGTSAGTGGDISSSGQSELEKQQERYAQSLRELNARRKVEAMSVDEYNKAYADITKNALISAMSSPDKGVSGSDYAGKLAEDYRQAMMDIAMATTRNIVEDLEEEVRAEATPVRGRRDTTFDYKKSDVEKLSEELDIWDEYRNRLQRAVTDGADYLVEELNGAMGKVSSLEDALKIAEIQEDIKNLSRELNENIYDGVKSIASSSDRMVSAFQSLRDVMNDVDATAWEKIMAVWNAIMNSVDGVASVIRTIENISAISSKLAGAKESSEKAVAGKVAEAAADSVATATTVANAKLKTSAAMTEMAAKSTAAYAGIPFAGTGLAAAQIAAMTAMIEAARGAIPQFANGGIISGGPYSGDKILARVNAGEMILNTRQQGNLFKALNGGITNRSGQLSSTVSTRVRAKDLILTINNELKSQGKKTIS